MQPQRLEPEPIAAAEVAARPWLPEGVGEQDAAVARYASIDDLDEGLAILVVTTWPHYDEFGRVRFEEDGEVVAFPPPELQARVDDLRRAGHADEAVATRPLRIGDAFAIHPADPDDLTGPWDRVVDVTGAARELAKMALYGAVAPRLTLEQERELLAAERTSRTESESTGAAAPPPKAPGPSAAPGV